MIKNSICVVDTELHLIVWRFNNDTSGNVIYFSVNNSLSSHAGNLKNNFLVLGEDPTFEINECFGSPEKKFSINSSKSNTKCYLNLHYNADNSYLFVKGKEIFKLKAGNKNVNFATQFCLRMDLVLLILEKYF